MWIARMSAHRRLIRRKACTKATICSTKKNLYETYIAKHPFDSRVAADGGNLPAESRTFFGSAYISPEQDRLVVVVSNLSDSAVKCRLSLKDLQPKAVTSYTTTLKKHLQPQQLTPSVNEYELDASSVTTLVFEL